MESWIHSFKMATIHGERFETRFHAQKAITGGYITDELDEIRRASRYPKLQAVLQPTKVGAMINNLQRAMILDRLTIETKV